MEYQAYIQGAISINVFCPECKKPGWFQIYLGDTAELPCPNCGRKLRVGLEPVAEPVEPEEPNG